MRILQNLLFRSVARRIFGGFAVVLLLAVLAIVGLGTMHTVADKAARVNLDSARAAGISTEPQSHRDWKRKAPISKFLNSVSLWLCGESSSAATDSGHCRDARFSSGRSVVGTDMPAARHQPAEMNTVVHACNERLNRPAECCGGTYQAQSKSGGLRQPPYGRGGCNGTSTR
jgi:hypothetical protein